MAIRLRELSRVLPRALVAAAVASGSGCGVRATDGDSQVWGRVTVRGAPVTDGTVVLMPAGDKDVTWGAGNLDKDGRFHIVCSRPDVPLKPGRYAVYVRPIWRLDPETEELVPVEGYPVPAKYLDENKPAVHVQIKDEPTMLDLKLDD